MADSGLSAHDHKAAVRHSGRNVQTLHSFSGTHFRTDSIPPDQWSRRPAKTAFGLIHTPHCAPLQTRLRPLVVTLLRFRFDSFSIRSGRARARARCSGAGWGRRDRGMYQINGRRGVVRLSRQRRNERGESDRSGGRSRRCPRAIGFGSKEAKGRSADQVSLHVEVVVDGGVSREEPLR